MGIIVNSTIERKNIWADSMTAQQSKNSAIRPLVSVIMNCLNCEKYLKEAIDSVYAQTYRNWEIIFWDNASTDSGAEIAKKYDKRLRYFRGEETIPLGAARNKALEQAKGKFIAFLDGDDLWMPEKLEKQVPLFNDPQVGLVYSDVIIFNNNDESRLSDRFTFYRGMCFSQLLKNYFLSIPSVIIRKTALDQEIEWFDQSFNLIEDADLFIRIGYSWNLDMCRDALAKYRVHKSSCTSTQGDLFHREHIILLEKYCNLWPDFLVKYYDILKTQIYCMRASYLWRNKRAKEARNCLSHLKFKNFNSFLLYLASFVPHVYVGKILAKHRKVVKVVRNKK